jgi:hypothetical protein
MLDNLDSWTQLGYLVPAEAKTYASNAMANIRLPRPQRRFRRAAFLPPSKKLLGSPSMGHLYNSSG